MNCTHCEERMSDYLERTLNANERAAMDLHLASCRACLELLEAIGGVIVWGKQFPVYEAPPWLATRIIANTPRVERETWLDTLAGIGRWLIEPRTAMGLLTTVLMVGWLGSVAGISAPSFGSLVRNPAATCYQVYDDALRTFYHAPFVTAIQSRIDRLREIS